MTNICSTNYPIDILPFFVAYERSNNLNVKKMISASATTRNFVRKFY